MTSTKVFYEVRLYDKDGNYKGSVNVDTLQEAEKIWQQEKVKPTVWQYGYDKGVMVIGY